MEASFGPKTGLLRGEYNVGLGPFCDFLVDDFLKKFGQEDQLGDWSIRGEVVLELSLFVDNFDFNYFPGFGHVT